MSRNKPTVEWVFLAENERHGPWPPVLHDQEDQSVPDPHQRLRRIVLFGVFFAILLVAGLGVTYARQEALQGVLVLEQEIQDAVAAEEWVRENAPVVAADSLVDEAADPQWREHFRREIIHSAGEQVAVGNVVLRSGLAMVEVTVEDTAGTRTRESRFYREDQNGTWLRTSPRAEFWGASQMVETTHFHIHFRQKDSHAVAGAAIRLDRIYTNLRQDAGSPPDGEKLNVEVTTLFPVELGYARYLAFENRRLAVPSPLLLRLPAELSDEELLIQSIVHPLAVQVLAEAQQQAAVRREWRFMLRGLALWQAYVGAESFVPWYRDTAAWLYHHAPARRARQQTATPEDLLHLCREYATWHYALPVSLSLPWLCTNPDGAPRLAVITESPARLATLVDTGGTEYSPTGQANDDWALRVGAATVVDYIVDTYGRERIPELLAGFRVHDSWETLAPAVFGVSAQELERGWLAYVADSGSQ